MGVISIGLFIFWYVKRSRRRRRSKTVSSEKGVYPPQDPPKPQSEFRKTISSLASTLKGSPSPVDRSSRGPGADGLGTMDKKSRLPSWSHRFSRRTSAEPVELPDISTCPYAYTNHPPPARADSMPCEEEIPIGISASSTIVGSAPSMVSHNREGSQATRSSSVMIMYVKSWLPGGAGDGGGVDDSALNNYNYNNNNNRRSSIRASSTFRKGSFSSAVQSVSASTYEVKQDNTLGNSQPAWQQRLQQQEEQEQEQEQNYQHEFSPIDEKAGVLPRPLYDDKRFSWASTSSSTYSDMEELSAMTNNTATRQSAARIPHPPRGPYR